ncbi:MAG: hypothetical protein MUQ20_03165, partial [Deltaproteobacteria bacterium]|nr:hypothetical protein [Deltaproteobacteria bacterium]
MPPEGKSNFRIPPTPNDALKWVSPQLENSFRILSSRPPDAGRNETWNAIKGFFPAHDGNRILESSNP